ncbi:MAG: transcriptional regulator [Anaerolineaceae bacterium]|nr:MAG: transcriptional regulator [Anaerolineaceae bacterium]
MRDYNDTASKFKIIGHPARLQILDMLRRGETCVCHIETALDKRQSYISQQLMILRDAGLVASRRDGLQVYYWLADEQIISLLNWFYGDHDDDGLQCLDGCGCPHCVSVAVADPV